MHELAVTESILEISTRHAAQAGKSRITDIYIVIGQLSSIVDDSVQFYWDILSEGSGAEGSKLHFRRVPAEMTCLNCSNRYQPTPDELACPACGSLRVKVTAGEEFYLDYIEVI
jgi:hydrogenase nickel incorporation protein HypA/HybF